MVQVAVSTARLMRPVDVGGALLGGMDGSMDLAVWAAMMGGVLLVALLRLPGFRLAWITAGGLPIVLGALALWRYPDDHGGGQIFSPQRSDIVGVMAVAGVFLAVGVVLHRSRIAPRLSGGRWRPAAVRLLAMAGLAGLFIALPVMREIERRQAQPPPCAHDSEGRQLTLCLKAYDGTGETAR